MGIGAAVTAPIVVGGILCAIRFGAGCVAAGEGCSYGRTRYCLLAHANIGLVARGDLTGGAIPCPTFAELGLSVQ